MQEYRLKQYRGTWCIVFRSGSTTKRVSLRTKDRGEAERQYHDYLKAAQVEQETVGDIMLAWLKEREGKPSYFRGEISYRKHMNPRFGNLRPEQITKSLCRDYTAFRRKAGVTDWTIRRELGDLRAALYWHDKNSKAEFELPPEGKTRDRYLTQEEVIRLIDGAKAEHIKLFIRLAIASSGRMGALLDLTWDRVDFKHGLISLANGQHKLKGRATVPMGEDIREALTQAYKARTCDFVIEHGSEGIKSVKKGIAEAAKRAGLENVSAHTLRHSAAVWMAGAGVSLDKIAQYMGHTDTRITYKHYARFSPDHLADAAAALDLRRFK